MNKQEFFQIVLEKIKKHGPDCGVNILHSDFVCDCVDTFKWSATMHFSGAPFCNHVGTTLAAMYKAGLLTRSRVGISGMGIGWPRWVFNYELPKKTES